MRLWQYSLNKNSSSAINPAALTTINFPLAYAANRQQRIHPTYRHLSLSLTSKQRLYRQYSSTQEKRMRKLAPVLLSVAPLKLPHQLRSTTKDRKQKAKRAEDP
jgi:hypothetical protein